MRSLRRTEQNCRVTVCIRLTGAVPHGMENNEETEISVFYYSRVDIPGVKMRHPKG